MRRWSRSKLLVGRDEWVGRMHGRRRTGIEGRVRRHKWRRRHRAHRRISWRGHVRVGERRCGRGERCAGIVVVRRRREGVHADGRRRLERGRVRERRFVLNLVEEREVRLNLLRRKLPSIVAERRVVRRRLDVVAGMENLTRDEGGIALRSAVVAGRREVVLVDEERVISEERVDTLLSDEALERRMVLEVEIHSRAVLPILRANLSSASQAARVR